MNAIYGATAAGARLAITPPLATDNAGFIVPKTVIYTMDENGMAIIPLNVNPAYPIKYTFGVFGDNEKPLIFSRFIAAGTDVSLKTLFDAGVVLPVGDPLYVYIDSLLAANAATRGTASAFGNVRVDNVSVKSVNGVLSSVLTTMTAVAPADADITANQLFMYFDPTPGASKVKFKGKNANGVVVTGEINLT